MKMDLFEIGIVDLGFRCAKHFKDFYCAIFCRLADRCSMDDLPDFFQAAMRVRVIRSMFILMAVSMRMFMCMRVSAALRMLMFMAMGVFVGVRRLRLFFPELLRPAARPGTYRR